jgi:hypothetical protein
MNYYVRKIKPYWKKLKHVPSYISATKIIFYYYRFFWQYWYSGLDLVSQVFHTGAILQPLCAGYIWDRVSLDVQAGLDLDLPVSFSFLLASIHCMEDSLWQLPSSHCLSPILLFAFLHIAGDDRHLTPPSPAISWDAVSLCPGWQRSSWSLPPE